MPSETPDRSLVQSDVTVFSIIEHLMESNDDTVTNIANELELAKSGFISTSKRWKNRAM